MPLLDDVAAGRADLAVGRRRPAGRGVWPWHARAGNALVVAWLRRRIGMAAHDIAPDARLPARRRCWTWASGTGGSATRVELLQRAAAAGWRFAEHDVAYHPRAAGTRSKVSGSVRGTRPDRPRLRPGAAMNAPVLRRRQGAGRGPGRRPGSVPTSAWTRAAGLAAAALLDTLDACVAAFGVGRCRLALEGDIADAVRGDRLAAALDGWAVFAAARRRPGRAAGPRTRSTVAEEDGPVVQIGMDTPQVDAADLHRDVLDGLADHDAVLGRAEDGGWWALGLARPAPRRAPASACRCRRPAPGVVTRAALEQAGLRVGRGPVLRDVDTVEDADAVAAACGEGSEFAALWMRSRG